MTGINLPHIMRDGQKAYADKLMQNFDVIVNKLNHVMVNGMHDMDMETALNQIKAELDAERRADEKVVNDFFYDDGKDALVIRLESGAEFSLPVTALLKQPEGAAGAEVSVYIGEDRRIHAELEDGAVQEAHLSPDLVNKMDQAVKMGVTGNADQIRFADGETMQEKLDQNAFRGADGVHVTLDSIYYFRVDPNNGHLIMGVSAPGSRPPLHIDASGHLIYTIE